ncbi:hypothetical protein QEP66_16200 [Streptomyces sp. LB8]|uniref:hypothetical protein n=1 Tax=Streptomyces sp. LB8 TaxID=3042509 RepID=UPI0026485F22|nr:hypothetical protein [Streptomyces sp. LB8]MDN5383602.1 hypothetical protein [Streptomyces sp. LB8]
MTAKCLPPAVAAEPVPSTMTAPRLAPLIDAVLPHDRPDHAYRRLAEGNRTRPKVLLRMG